MRPISYNLRLNGALGWLSQSTIAPLNRDIFISGVGGPIGYPQSPTWTKCDNNNMSNYSNNIDERVNLQVLPNILFRERKEHIVLG